MTTQQIVAEPRKIRIQPHRLGMGWHYLWEYDPPIEHHVVRPDGTPYYWRDTGETSEGCIMWLADCFATQYLKTTAREIYQLAYKEHDDDQFEDDWVATDALKDAWSRHTTLPKRWTPAKVRKLFEDLEDVNYHSFLARLIELIEQRLPELAAKLNGWCKPATIPTSLPLTDPA
jgi:hypothetical protein